MERDPPPGRPLIDLIFVTFEESAKIMKNKRAAESALRWELVENVEE